MFCRSAQRRFDVLVVRQFTEQRGVGLVRQPVRAGRWRLASVEVGVGERRAAALSTIPAAVRSGLREAALSRNSRSAS